MAERSFHPDALSRTDEAHGSAADASFPAREKTDDADEMKEGARKEKRSDLGGQDEPAQLFHDHRRPYMRKVCDSLECRVPMAHLWPVHSAREADTNGPAVARSRDWRLSV